MSAMSSAMSSAVPSATPNGEQQVSLSVVIPCYNEEESLPRLVEVLEAQLGALTEDYEVILVDDGSRRRSLAIRREAHPSRPRFRYLSLSRKFGM